MVAVVGMRGGRVGVDSDCVRFSVLGGVSSNCLALNRRGLERGAGATRIRALRSGFRCADEASSAGIVSGDVGKREPEPGKGSDDSGEDSLPRRSFGLVRMRLGLVGSVEMVSGAMFSGGEALGDSGPGLVSPDASGGISAEGAGAPGSRTTSDGCSDGGIQPSARSRGRVAIRGEGSPASFTGTGGGGAASSGAVSLPLSTVAVDLSADADERSGALLAAGFPPQP